MANINKAFDTLDQYKNLLNWGNILVDFEKVIISLTVELH